MIGKEAQAEFLLEAMPYIEKYQNKVLVIKYGGNAMLGDDFKWSVMRDLTLLRFVGSKSFSFTAAGPKFLKRSNAWAWNPVLSAGCVIPTRRRRKSSVWFLRER